MVYKNSLILECHSGTDEGSHRATHDGATPRLVVSVGKLSGVVDRVALCPLARLLVEGLPVVDVLANEVRAQAVVGVRVAQQRGQAKQ